ncbi:MAG: hypothetical protein K2F53_05150 [Rikenellaceae bacterium]|nr:hypothetical protein [Rikenellaceae bacterium]MDE7134544.1 hypothetical protein [Rikenellaceae bacterium]MDE7355741.1 hypothetical protein [Rikenellaceae bacterium]
MLKKVFLVALSTLFFVAGCKKEQTSLSIDDIPTKARIVGNITCMTQLVDSTHNGLSTSIYAGVSNKKVTLTIDNSQLAPNGKGNGVSAFTCTTDINGNFDIEVPVIDANTSVTVIPEPFIGSYVHKTVMKDVNDTYEETENVEVLFSASRTFRVSPYGITVADFEYNTQKR